MVITFSYSNVLRKVLDPLRFLYWIVAAVFCPFQARVNDPNHSLPLEHREQLLCLKIKLIGCC